MSNKNRQTEPAAGSHILMNVVDEEELRVALLRDGRLESLLHERIATTQQLGNIYKARVANVEPSLDAAFLELGGEKNGFIHVDDLRHDKGDKARIEQIIKPGQELVVQIVKEAIKDKGPCVTQQLAIPGRYLVLVSDAAGKRGVSKKIADDATRRRLRSVLGGFEPPDGFGYIVRTAGADRLDEELALDHSYLTEVWRAIDQRIGSNKAPALLYREADVVVRSLRDLVTADTASIIIDEEGMYEEARAFAQIFMPELADRIVLHKDKQPLFAAYGVEERLGSVLDKRVELPSGGNVVIEQTEALVSIDVNSAKNRSADNVEQTALLTNLEAVQTVAEQLLLRDLGGLIIIDFIDMENRDHQRLVQLALRRALLRDPAKTFVAAMSRFGLIEMTRQRRRPSHRMMSSMECAHCNGTGVMKTVDTLAIESMRQIRAELNRQPCARVEVIVPTDVAIGILNARGAEIAQLQEEHDCSIQITGDSLMKNRAVRLQSSARKRRGRRRVSETSEPVRPSLLAPLVEEQSAIAAEARKLKNMKLRDLERELHAEPEPAVAAAAPARSEAAPDQARPAPVSPAAAGAATVDGMVVQAAALRRLLFTPPDRVPVVDQSLALRSPDARKPSPRGRRRRRARA